MTIHVLDVVVLLLTLILYCSHSVALAAGYITKSQSLSSEISQSKSHSFSSGRSLSKSGSLSQEAPSWTDTQEQTLTSSRSCNRVPRFSIVDGNGTANFSFATCASVCVQRRSFLATPQTAKEQQAASLAVRNLSTPIMIGANSLVGGAAYTWQAGQAAGTIFYASIAPGGACGQASCPFAAGQPANGAGQNVLTISSLGLWEAAVDGTVGGCLCERWYNVCPGSRTITLSNSFSSMKTQSPSGGEGSTSSTHSVSKFRSRSNSVSKTMSEKGRQKIFFGFWEVTGNYTNETELVDDRNNKCMQNVNGTLATIMSPQEHFYASGVLNSTSKFMTAGNRLLDGTNFRWMYGPYARLIIFTNKTLATGTCVTYCPWNSGEPNNFRDENEDLLSLQISGWNDNVPDRQNGYVCEKYVDHFNHHTFTLSTSHFTPTLSHSRSASPTPSVSVSFSASFSCSLRLTPSATLKASPSRSISGSSSMSRASVSMVRTSSASPTGGVDTVTGLLTTSGRPSAGSVSSSETSDRSASRSGSISSTFSQTLSTGASLTTSHSLVSMTSSFSRFHPSYSETMQKSASHHASGSASISLSGTAVMPSRSSSSSGEINTETGLETASDSLADGSATMVDAESDTIKSSLTRSASGTSGTSSTSLTASAVATSTMRSSDTATLSAWRSPSATQELTGTMVEEASTSPAATKRSSSLSLMHSLTDPLAAPPASVTGLVSPSAPAGTTFTVSDSVTVAQELAPAPPLPTAGPGTSVPIVQIPGLPPIPAQPKYPNMLLVISGLSGMRVVIPSRDARNSVTISVQVLPSAFSSLRPVDLYYQQSLTGAVFDGVTYSPIAPVSSSSSSSCTSLQPHYFSTAGCFALLQCNSNPLGTMMLNQGAIGPVRITLGRGVFDNPLCGSQTTSLVASFVVAVSRSANLVADGPQYSYALLLGSPSALVNLSISVMNMTMVPDTERDGVVMNVSLREGRATLTPLRQLIKLKGDLQSDTSPIISLTPVTSKANLSSLCVIRNVMSFAARVVFDRTESLSGNYTVDCSPSSASAYPEELQLSCIEDTACAGYITSSSFTTDVELGVCFLRLLVSSSATSGAVVDPSAVFPRRILYMKTSAAQRTCQASVDGGQFGGTLKIFVQQTYFASSAAVEVDATTSEGVTRRVAICGGSQTFFQGIYGSSSQCGLYVMCSKTLVASESTATVFRVVADASLAQGGCDNALGVLFAVEYFSSAAAAPPPPPPTAAPPTVFLAEAEVQTFSVGASISLSSNSVASLYVVNVARTLLSVRQTGFDCSLDPRVSCHSLPPLVKVTTIRTLGSDDLSAVGGRASDPISTCGGSSPFIFGVGGASDATCASSLYCSVPLVLASESLESSPLTSTAREDHLSLSNITSVVGEFGATPCTEDTAVWSGWIRVTADVQTISRLRGGGSSGICSVIGTFQADLVASPSSNSSFVCQEVRNNSNKKVFAGFALRSGSTMFPTLLLPRRAAASATIAKRVVLSQFFNTSRISYPMIQLLPGLGNSFPTDVLRDAYLVRIEESPNSSNTMLRQGLLPEVTLGCVADWFDQPQGNCEFPVPETANYFILSVGQIHVTKTSSISVDFLSADGTVQTSRRCGGSSGFSGLASRSNQCRSFLNCSLGYLASFGENITLIRLTFPQENAFGDYCPQAFSSMVTFHRDTSANANAPRIINQTVLAAYNGFVMTCSATNGLVTGSRICDGVIDCPDGSDEASCADWFKVEYGIAFIMYKVAGNFTVNSSVGECRTLAAARQSVAFALSVDRTMCTVYDPNLAQIYVANPSRYLIVDPRYNLYVLLPGGPQSYSRCSAELTCSGHGALASTAPGSICQCECQPGFAGADCSDVVDMVYIGTTVVTVREDSGLSPQDVEFALSSLSKSPVTVKCTSFESSLGSEKVVRCAVSGGTDALSQYHAGAVMRDVVQQMNIALSSSSPSVGIVSIVLSTAPVLAEVFSCNTSADWLVGSCQLRDDSTADTIIVTATASSAFTPPIQITVHRLGNTSTAHRTFSTQSSSIPDGTIYTCIDGTNAVVSVDRSGCYVTVCKLSRIDVIASRVDYKIDAASVNTEDPCFQPVTVSVAYAVNVSQVVPVDRVVNVARDFTAFVIGGSIVVLVALALGAKGAVMAYVDWKNSMRACAIDDDDGRSSVTKSNPAAFKVVSLVALLLRRMDYYSTKPRPIRTERWSVASAVISFNVVIAGIFLILYFYSSGGYTSNAEVIVEFHRDSGCGNSSFAPLPIRVTYVKIDTAKLCMQRPFGGLSVDGSGLFVEAYCTSSGGTEAVVHARLGLSASDCSSRKVMTFVSGSCVPAYLINAAFNDSSYISFVCGTVASVQSRYSGLLNLSLPPAEVDRDVAKSRSVDPSWLPWIKRAALGGSSALVVVRPRIRNKQVLAASSNLPNVYESVADAAHVVETSVPERFILQDISALETNADDVLPSYYLDSATSLQYSAWSMLANISSSSDASFMSTFTPQFASVTTLDEDFPIGFMYSGFNASEDTAQSWRDTAGAEAARYYAVQQTPADLGAFLSSLEEGQGMTITLYLRATLITFGFAFAVVDGREELTGGTSPIVERLLVVLESGGIENSLWSPSPYNIYGSLFVDGPSMVLRFIFSTSGGALQELVWDIEALGLTRIFNGQWHHVALILRLENGPKGQLVVDGETSLSVPGWNQCFTDGSMPQPIQNLDSVACPVTNEMSERVTSGGMLFTGYFNGGVGKLQFLPKALDIFDLWKSSTSAIMAVRSPPIDKFRILALCLLGSGCMMMVVLVGPCMLAFYRSSQASSAKSKKKEKAARVALGKIWGGDHVMADPSSGEPYKKISCSKVMEMLKLSSHEDMIAILHEIRSSYPKEPGRNLVRICFHMHEGTLQSNTGVNERYPSASEWILAACSEQSLGMIAVHSSSPEEDASSAPTTIRGGASDVAAAAAVDFAWSITSSVDTETGFHTGDRIVLRPATNAETLSSQKQEQEVAASKHAGEVPAWFDDISLESIDDPPTPPPQCDRLADARRTEVDDLFTGDICVDDIAVSETSAEAAAMAFYTDLDQFPDFFTPEEYPNSASSNVLSPSGLFKKASSDNQPKSFEEHCEGPHSPSAELFGEHSAARYSFASCRQVSFWLQPTASSSSPLLEHSTLRRSSRLEKVMDGDDDDVLISQVISDDDGGSPSPNSPDVPGVKRRCGSRLAWAQDDFSLPPSVLHEADAHGKRTSASHSDSSPVAVTLSRSNNCFADENENKNAAGSSGAAAAVSDNDAVWSPSAHSTLAPVKNSARHMNNYFSPNTQPSEAMGAHNIDQCQPMQTSTQEESHSSPRRHDDENPPRTSSPPLVVVASQASPAQLKETEEQRKRRLAEQRENAAEEEDDDDGGDDGGDDSGEKSGNQPVGTAAILGPILWILQSVYVYMTTMSLPGSYSSIFQPIFSVLSVDLRVATAAIPQTIMLLLQLVCGLLSLSVLFYALRNDEMVFAWFVGRYVSRSVDVLSQDEIGDDTRKEVEAKNGDCATLVEAFAHDVGDVKVLEHDADADCSSTANAALIYKVNEEAENDDGDEPPKTSNVPVKHSQKDVLPFSFARWSAQLRDLISTVEHPLGNMVEYPSEVTVHVLPLPEAQRLDRFLGRVSGSPFNLADQTAQRIDVRLMLEDNEQESRVLAIERSSSDANLSDMSIVVVGGSSGIADCEGINTTAGDQQHSLPIASSLAVHADLALEGISCKCAIHQSRLLSVQRQTEIWPFCNRPQCSIVVGGVPCGRSTGLMYRCGYEVDDDHDAPTHLTVPRGCKTQCEYALCEEHYRGSLFYRLLAVALAYPLRARDAGAFSVLASACLYVTNILYTPVVKTALMILSCHPSFQCEFGSCWAQMTQSYILTAYLCFAIVCFLGIGLPFVLALLLRRRQVLLHSVFFSEGSPLFTCDESHVDDEEGEGEEADKPTNKVDKRREAADERYEMFAATDTTALANVYQAFKFEWIFIAPILLAWKIVLLAPPVFLETNSFSQLVGEAVAEAAFAAFLFILSPSKSNVVNGILRLGCVHQQIFLGLVALDKFNRLHGGADVSTYLICVTCAYLLISFGVYVYSQIIPAVARVTRTVRTRGMLERRGIQYSRTTGMYPYQLIEAVRHLGNNNNV